MENNENNNFQKNETVLVNNDGKIMEIDEISMNYILKYIENNFSLKNFSYFKTEKHVLEYFYVREKYCLVHIEENFNKKKEMHHFFKNFAINIIEDIFKNNHEIYSIKKKIEKESNEIIKKFKDNENLILLNLKDIYLEIFKTEKVPIFIEGKIIEEIQNYRLINGLNHNIFLEEKNLNNKKNLEEELKVYYNKLVKGITNAFEFSDKKTIFNILLFSNLEDIYKNEKIKNIFINNYLDICECLNSFDNDFIDIINNKKDQNYIKNKLKESFNNYKINDSHIYIITSFFYLIMNVMKDTRNIYKQNANINNPLFINILKNILNNFTIFCPDKIYNLETYSNLLIYFNKYIILIKYGEIENKKYDFETIKDKIQNSFYFESYHDFEEIFEKLNKKKNIKELIKGIMKLDILGSIKEFTELIEQNINLIPIIKIRNSNTITILISGFLSQNDDINSWEKFLNYEKNNSNYYIFRWPSSDIPTLIFKSYINVLNTIELFVSCKNKAKYAGKILGIFLACNDEFNNCQINLVGFSLGCQVIKYCIKQLEKIKGHRDMINNVLFMGGASIIKNNKKNIWRNIFINNVEGRIINCYSTEDYVLRYLFKLCVSENPIGLNNINLKDEEGKYKIIEDYDFSYLNLGHLEYRDKFDIILQTINFHN